VLPLCQLLRVSRTRSRRSTSKCPIESDCFVLINLRFIAWQKALNIPDKGLLAQSFLILNVLHVSLESFGIMLVALTLILQAFEVYLFCV
jgi:hypothetical protein